MRIRATFVACVFILGGCQGRMPPEDPEGAPYGAPCEGNLDCASGACLATADPSCTHECVDDCVCPAGAVCARVSETLSVCAPGENTCVVPVDGGTPPVDGGAPPADSGPVVPRGGAGAPCTSSVDCADVQSPGGTGSRPVIMTVPQECFTEARTGLPGGLCSMTECAANFVRDPCPTGTGCIRLTSGSVCLVACDGPSDCRPGWVCRDDVDASGPNHEDLCWFSCTRTGCAAGFTCQPDGTCTEPAVPPGPLDGCTDWASWSCVDRSPSLCACSCPSWPRSGTAPMIDCELTAVGLVTCTCRTGGEASDRVTGTVDLAAGGAGCGQARTVFEGAFCGLVP